MAEEYDLNYFNNLPIKDVAACLGIQINDRGQFLSPCHNDHTPSASINTHSPKYKNTWRDWVTEESGGNISLVMAKLYNVNPSEVAKERQLNNGRLGKYSETFKKAIHFLEMNFPGGIKHIDVEPPVINGQTVTLPEISSTVIAQTGLRMNPFYDEKYKNFSLTDKAEVLLDAIISAIEDRKGYAIEVLKTYPMLDKAAQEAIKLATKVDIKALEEAKDELRDFYIKCLDIEYSDFNLEHEETVERE